MSFLLGYLDKLPLRGLSDYRHFDEENPKVSTLLFHFDAIAKASGGIKCHLRNR